MQHASEEELELGMLGDVEEEMEEAEASGGHGGHGGRQQQRRAATREGEERGVDLGDLQLNVVCATTPLFTHCIVAHCGNYEEDVQVRLLLQTSPCNIGLW